MKTSKKLVSLFLALVLLVGMFSISAMAAADEGTVTVYITKGMFTPGDISETGEVIPQEYIGNTVPDGEHYFQPNAAWCKVEVDVKDINVSETKLVYNPTGESVPESPNVLDAIISALRASGSPVKEINGGWDAEPVEGDPGGYINGFTPDGMPTPVTVETVEKYGTKYTMYSGWGWQIATGTAAAGSIRAISSYGTNYGLTNGMVIVFDFSEYNIYYPAA